MNRFQIINSRNTRTDSSEKFNPNQLWGVIISECTEIGSQLSFGVALNESTLTTVMVPEDHPYTDRLKSHFDDLIGKLLYIFQIEIDKYL